MGKQAKPRVLADSEAKSVLRNLRISPQKLNLVAAMIRGVDANKALATLTFSRRRIAGDVKKALQSAIANAENNHSLDVDRLFVKMFGVDKLNFGSFDQIGAVTRFGMLLGHGNSSRSRVVRG